MEYNLDIVNELFKKLSELQPLKPEDKNRLGKKFRLEFNYNSNHIEGNTLTYGETELLLIFDDTRGNHSMREYEETKAHDVAYQMIEQWAKESERPLTEQAIKELNEIILVRPYWKEAITPDGQNTRRQIKVGNYKEFPNSVRLQNGEIFNYASPVETPILMQELIDWYNAEESAVHPVNLATMLHYKFVRIHPFDDGNGRISRLLMNYVLLKFGYPPVIIKSSDKNNYLRVLHLADVGDMEPLFDYVSEQLIWSFETSIKAAKGESLEDADDFIKEIEILKRKASSKGTLKSVDTTKNLYNLVFVPIYQELSTTLRYFDGLFKQNTDTFNIYDASGQFQYSSQYDFIRDILMRIRPEEWGTSTDSITDVIRVNWHHNMFSLNGTEEVSQTIVYLEMHFNKYNYKLELKSSDTTVYANEKSNTDFLSKLEFDKINQLLKQHLLGFIKNKIN